MTSSAANSNGGSTAAPPAPFAQIPNGGSTAAATPSPRIPRSTAAATPAVCGGSTAAVCGGSAAAATPSPRIPRWLDEDAAFENVRLYQGQAGRGLLTTRPLRAGECAARDLPVAALQHTFSRRLTQCCSCCMRPLGGVVDHCERILAEGAAGQMLLLDGLEAALRRRQRGRATKGGAASPGGGLEEEKKSAGGGAASSSAAPLQAPFAEEMRSGTPKRRKSEDGFVGADPDADEDSDEDDEEDLDEEDEDGVSCPLLRQKIDEHLPAAAECDVPPVPCLNQCGDYFCADCHAGVFGMGLSSFSSVSPNGAGASSSSAAPPRTPTRPVWRGFHHFAVCRSQAFGEFRRHALFTARQESFVLAGYTVAHALGLILLEGWSEADAAGEIASFFEGHGDWRKYGESKAECEARSADLEESYRLLTRVFCVREGVEAMHRNLLGWGVAVRVDSSVVASARGITSGATSPLLAGDSADLLNDFNVFMQVVRGFFERHISLAFISRLLACFDLVNVSINFDHPMNGPLGRDFRRHFYGSSTGEEEQLAALLAMEGDEDGVALLAETTEEKKFLMSSLLSVFKRVRQIHEMEGEDSPRSPGAGTSKKRGSVVAVTYPEEIFPPREEEDGSDGAADEDGPFPEILGNALVRTVSLVNHSCDPNVEVVFSENSNAVFLCALRGIPVNEELFISYVDEALPLDERQRLVKRNYDFTCTCDKCRVQKAVREWRGRTATRKQDDQLPGGRWTFQKKKESVQKLEERWRKVTAEERGAAPVGNGAGGSSANPNVDGGDHLMADVEEDGADADEGLPATSTGPKPFGATPLRLAPKEAANGLVYPSATYIVKTCMVDPPTASRLLQMCQEEEHAEDACLWEEDDPSPLRGPKDNEKASGRHAQRRVDPAAHFRRIDAMMHVGVEHEPEDEEMDIFKAS